MAVPKHVNVVVGQVMELHVPGLGRHEVVLDVHQEPVSLDLVEADRRVLRWFRLNALQPSRIGVDVQPAAMLGDE